MPGLHGDICLVLMVMVQNLLFNIAEKMELLLFICIQSDLHIYRLLILIFDLMIIKVIRPVYFSLLKGEVPGMFFF